jgi:hypothetical protein
MNSAHFDVGLAAKRFKRRYALWCAITPTVAFLAAFAALCVRECSALPWLAFLIAPGVSLVVIAIVAISVWLRVGDLPDEERSSVRWFVATSILWAPLAGIAGFYVALTATQAVAALASILFGAA